MRLFIPKSASALAALRERVADEIERLINFLDATDPDVDREEDYGEREPDADTEPSRNPPEWGIAA